jgi:hypothetical protein
MSPPLNKFRTHAAVSALAFTVLAGLGGATYALAEFSAGPSRHTPGVDAVRPPAQTVMLAVRVLGSRHSVTIGGTVKYGVQIVRVCRPVRLCGRLDSHRAARVWLRLVKPVPAGLTARFTRPVTRAQTTALVLGVRTTARPGHYRLRLLAGTSPQLGSGHTASTSVTLTVTAPSGPALRITGSPADALVPGGVAGVDMALTNLQRRRIVVTRVIVSVKQVQAPRADAADPCTAADFAVSQLSGSYRLALAPSSTRTLDQLGIDPSRWPTVAMLDSPLNQDGCEGASVILSYAGTATG